MIKSIKRTDKTEKHSTVKNLLVTSLNSAIKESGFDPEKIKFSVEPPANNEYGDYATNAALLLSSAFKKPPYAVAQDIVKILDKDARFNKIIQKKTIAGPGFINFYMSPGFRASKIRDMLRDDYDYGRIDFGKRKKIQVEFISANPTGPLTLGNGRGGFLGDALSNILDFADYDVTREYFVNDAGEQIKKLGWSIISAGKVSADKEIDSPYKPEELYLGGYIQELAYKLDIAKFDPEDLNVESISRSASKLLLEDIKRITKKAKIHFDVWFSEKSLHRQGIVKEVLEALKKKGLVENKDGAWWLRLGKSEIKERVLIKSNGEPTYLISDIAYHWDKFKRRRFNKVIDIFGADHHATAMTLTEALGSLKLPKPSVILVQLVRLIENGEEVKMSKRTGTFVTLEELIDIVGLDAARFFFIMREPNSHMDFDLNLAKDKTEKNPVYYVQYAHARCSGIIERAAEEGIVFSETKDFSRSFSERIEHSSESALIRKLIRFPEIVEQIAENYEVSRLPYFVTEVASAFSAFYRDCKVITEDKELSQMRLALVRATKIVLANALKLMGIYAPEKM